MENSLSSACSVHGVSSALLRYELLPEIPGIRAVLGCELPLPRTHGQIFLKTCLPYYIVHTESLKAMHTTTLCYINLVSVYSV